MAHIQLIRSGDQDNGQRIRPTFRGDIYRSIPDLAAALVLSAIVFSIMAGRVRAGADPALQEMPSMIASGGVWPYTASQSFGWAALLWSWLTILLGVSLPIWGGQRRPRTRELVERLHRSTSLTVVGLIAAHAVLLVWDKMGDTLITVFIPWTTSYLPGRFPQTLGILSFYLAVLLGLSFYFRNRIGFRIWQLLHRYLIPAVYVLAVWHTLLYGSDIRVHNALWLTIWLLQLPIIGAFVVRLCIAAR